ncbi:MAG: DUF2125 domain-containing protein [Alphaproteobacteria bacterium]|mgnify:CR=1 FL=1|nr:DUF2125 domain-containing protein [Alphaproteobacteria bacterium]MDP6566241.1 DUF2125 domain-containing protein [Alphaproteobacteria bacterium]MDP6815186.1 DUF2125 domain-containing protein [Alphaproteobacteria bacterium]
MRLYLLLGGIAAVILGWTAYWFYIAGEARDAVEAWVAENQKAGVTAGYDAIEVGGFPYRIRIDLTAPRLALPKHRQRPGWRAERLAVIGHPWNLRHLLFDLTGVHTFSGLRPDGEAELSLRNGSGRASLQMDPDGGLQLLSLHLEDLRAETAGQVVLDGQEAQLHLRPSPEGNTHHDLALRGRSLEWPGAPEGWPRRLQDLELQARINDPALAAAAPAALAAWRDGGGTVDLQKLLLVWGQTRIEARGTLALDDAMRPIGALTARITGHGQIIDAAVAAGQMSETAAIAARTVLGLLASAAGGTLSVPVRLQDGQLFLGPVAIARLAPLSRQP